MGSSCKVVKTKTKLPHLPELDGLRGLAALAVFFHHFFQDPRDSPLTTWPPLLKFFLYLSGYGALGVDVFFVLSGYLITSLLLVDRDSPSYFHNFYWKRVLRIMPVYMVHLLVAALFIQHATGYILLSLIFVVNFAQLFRVADIGPAWTLSIEEQFYLIWPQFIRRLRLPAIYYLAFALAILSATARIIVPLWHGGLNLRYTIYRCDGLALGAILACQWFSSEGQTRLIRIVLGILNSNVALLLVFFAQTVMLLHFPRTLFSESVTLTTTNYLVYRIIHRIVFLRNRSGLSWLASPITVYLGGISYALYMYHTFILYFLGLHFGLVQPDHYLSTFIRATLSLLIVIAVCTISRYALELPVQRLRRFVLQPRKAGAESS